MDLKSLPHPFLVRALSAGHSSWSRVTSLAMRTELGKWLVTTLGTERRPAVVFGAGAAFLALLAMPALFLGPASTSAGETQAQLDALWAEADWIGVIALLEGVQRNASLTSQQKDALYAAYIAEAKPLIAASHFKDARPLLQRAVHLGPNRPEAKDLLGARERELKEFLHDGYGGAGHPNQAAPWYKHIMEITIVGEDASVRTDLQARESNKGIARSICEAVLGHQPAALESVSVLGTNGWSGAICRA